MLSARHPIALREAHFMPDLMPAWVRRFTNFWTLVGFAALIHGALFFVAILVYNTPNRDLISLISPFLTPFGTPIILAVLHSALYWSLLFGVSRHMAHSFGQELERQTWSVLRLTPYRSDELVIAKTLTVGRAWYGVLRVLFALRGCALLVLPVAFAAQRSREISAISLSDVLHVLIFMAQPFSEVFMVGSLSLLIAVLARQTRWARIFAYSALLLSIGALNGLSNLWLIVNTPIGALASLLMPIGHWTPLVAAAFPPRSAALHAEQTLVLALMAVIVPLLIGALAFGASLQRLRHLA
jgi:uncharacterized integral membrane protein